MIIYKDKGNSLNARKKALTPKIGMELCTVHLNYVEAYKSSYL